MDQERAKVSYGSALGNLQDCCQERKFGSKAKHALKDLTLHRLGHTALGILQRIVGALLDKGAMGKDEKKIFRFAYYFLAIIVEEHPEAAQSVLTDLERTTQCKDSSVQLLGYRTLGRLCAAMGRTEGLGGSGSYVHGARPRILQKLCAPLHEVCAPKPLRHALRDPPHSKRSTARTSFITIR